MVSINDNPQTQNLLGLNKLCRKCLNTFPATLEFFYKNKGGKYGLTPRCKPCVNVDNKITHDRLLKEDPQKLRAQATARTKKHYHANIDLGRERARLSATKARQDPVKYAKIQARKRAGGAGLTVEQIEEIRTSQNNLCAICSDPNPTDLDHCHKTKQVRFLLCKHCNRGLGAFRDQPAFLRKAADLLEAINAPVSAKT